MRALKVVAPLIGLLTGPYPPVIAAPLVPNRPSQLVTLGDGARINGPAAVSTCLGGHGRQLDTVIRADGTSAKFTIPKGQVLIVTDFSYEIGLTPDFASEIADGTAILVTMSGDGNTIAEGQSCHVGKNTCVGLAQGLMVAVRRDALPLCLAPAIVASDIAGGTLHGFLAPDK
jgi:hypothetical protein